MGIASFPGARRLAIAAMSAALVAIGLLPAPASAAPATVKGTFAGPGLPESGEGVTGVRAVNAETGAIDAADYAAGKRDKWKLRLDPGPYALGAAAVPFEGGKLVDRLVAFADPGSGDTETVKLRLKPKRSDRPAPSRRAARGGSGIGDVTVDFPAIWVKEFDVQSQNPELGVLRKGMAEMLITDLVAALGPPDCPGVVVERARIRDILNEQRLQRLPGFDPSTRVRAGRLIADNASVSGTLVESGGHVTITATYQDRRPGKGRTKSVAVQGPVESIFELEQQLAQKLVEAICADDLPDTYTGTFDGTSVDSEMTRTWNGTITLKRVRPPDPNAASCDSASTACYAVVDGSVTWQTSTTPGAHCSYQSPPKTVDLPRGSVALTVDARGGDAPGYAGGVAVDDSNTGTLHCGGNDPPGQVTYFPLDCCWATNSGSPWGDFARDGGWRLQGTRQSGGSGTSVTNNWDLTGQ